MGNTQPPVPPKTPRELQREMTRSIDRMVREFGRDKYKLQAEITRLKRDLEKAIKGKESKQTQRVFAQNILKNEANLRKYDMLEAKMKGVKLQVTQVATTDAMVGIMRGMADVLGKSTGNVNINNIQGVIEQFNVRMEEQQGVNEMLEDVVGGDEAVAEDADVDRYIDETVDRLGGGKGPGGQKAAVNESQTADFDQLLNELKR